MLPRTPLSQAPRGRPRIACLATFPSHVIPGFEQFKKRVHYATWLPQLVSCFAHTEEFDIHWVVSDRLVRDHEPVSWLGQTFHFVDSPSRLSALTGYWRDTLRIKAKVDSINPVLVHGWGTEDPSGYAAARSGRKHLLSVQGILTNYVRQSNMPARMALRAALERRLLSNVSTITVESKWGAAVLREFAPTAEIVRIEYGVNPLFYDVTWAPEQEKPVAVFVGTTEHRKGIDKLVEAFSDPRLADAECRIVGDTDSPLAKRLIPISPANVKWLGRLAPELVAEHLKEAWCLVLPTRADTSPNVVKESRVIGLPVITTPHGGQADYITDGRNGYLVEPDDIGLLTHRLRQLLGDFHLARSLGASGHESHRDFFKPENTARAFLQLYSQLIRSS